MESFIGKSLNHIRQLHNRPFREFGMTFKSLQCLGTVTILSWIAHPINYLQSGLIQQHFVLATAMAIMLIASAESERQYREKWDWRSILSIVGAIIAFYFIFSAGDRVETLDSSSTGEAQKSMPLAKLRIIVCWLIWLCWDGIIAPRTIAVKT